MRRQAVAGLPAQAVRGEFRGPPGGASAVAGAAVGALYVYCGGYKAALLTGRS
jgi:hypothetical protein